MHGLYLALITFGLAVLFPRVASKYVKGQGGVALLQPSTEDTKSLFTRLANDQYHYYLTLFVGGDPVRPGVEPGSVADGPGADRHPRPGAGCRSRWASTRRSTKVATFALSAAFAGVAGALSFMVDGVADATNPLIYFQLSIEFLVAVVIGGSATILGPLIGAAVLVFIQEQTTDLIKGKEILAPTVLGVALILIVYVLPDGVVGGYRRLAAWATRRWSSGRSAPPSDPIPTDATPETT